MTTIKLPVIRHVYVCVLLIRLYYRVMWVWGIHEQDKALDAAHNNPLFSKEHARIKAIWEGK